MNLPWKQTGTLGFLEFYTHKYWKEEIEYRLCLSLFFGNLIIIRRVFSVDFELVSKLAIVRIQRNIVIMVSISFLYYYNFWKCMEETTMKCHWWEPGAIIILIFIIIWMWRNNSLLRRDCGFKKSIITNMADGSKENEDINNTVGTVIIHIFINILLMRN